MTDYEANSLLRGATKAEQPYEVSMLKKCACELVGTFFLCATIALSAGQGEPEAPLAIGISLMVREPLVSYYQHHYLIALIKLYTPNRLASSPSVTSAGHISTLQSHWGYF